MIAPRERTQPEHRDGLRRRARGRWRGLVERVADRALESVGDREQQTDRNRSVLRGASESDGREVRHDRAEGAYARPRA